MSRTYIPVLMLILLVVEGTLFQLLMPDKLNQQWIIVPRFLIILLVFIGVYIGRNTSIIMGLCFGLLTDIVYTQLIGVYLFGFGIIGYTFALTHKKVQDSLLLQVLLVLGAVTLFECYQYGLFQIIGITNLHVEDFLNQRLLPTVILNGTFALVAFYPVKKLLMHVKLQARLRER